MWHMIAGMTVLSLICILQAQVILLDYLQTDVNVLQSYKNRIRELSFTNAMFTKHVVIDWQQYICYMPIVNDLLESARTANQTVSVAKDVLLPLNHLCAMYKTTQFIYEICPGRHVRQFDDTSTIQNMGKEKPEDISLGKHKLDTYSRQPTKALVSTVEFQNRYIVIEDTIGRTNYRLPFMHNRYGKDILDINCTNGKRIQSDVILISSYEFVLVFPHAGYCFGKVTSKVLQIGADRVSLPNGSIIKSNRVLIGNCQASGPYAFIKKNGEIKPYRVKQRINEQAIALEQKILGKQFTCEPLALTSNCTLEQIPHKLTIDGFVLTSEADLKLKSRDMLLIIYTLTSGESSAEQVNVDFVFTPKKILLQEQLQNVFKIKKLTAYIIHKEEKASDQPQIIDLTQKNEETMNTQSKDNSSKTLYRHFRLQKGQSIKLNSSEVYIIISGQSTMATLKGEEWLYVVKDRPIKIKLFPNGSKIIVDQNIYYQNGTLINDTFHITQECIWAQIDFREFCRLKAGPFHTIEAVTEIYVTIYNLSAPQNAYLRHQKKTRGDKPAKFLEVYEHGDMCVAPINKQRSISVEYVCGQSWFSIRNISEIRPCEYKLQVETQLLCEDSFELNVQEQSIEETVCFSAS